MPVARSSSSELKGSETSPWRRVATPASTRSTVSCGAGPWCGHGPTVELYSTTVDGAAPGGLDAKQPASDRHGAGGRAVPVGGPPQNAGVVEVATVGELVLHHLVHYHEADVGTEIRAGPP